VRATLEALGLLAVGTLLSVLLAAVGRAGLLALAAPVSVAPWTLVTGLYVHASLGHAAGNAVALLLVGPLVERRTTRVRFHAFFLATGALAGVAEVVLGPAGAVVGASGAIFALLGYLLAGNVVAGRLLDRFAVSARAQVALFLVVAVGLTLATGGPGVALIAHATGLLSGLLAGRVGLLEA